MQSVGSYDELEKNVDFMPKQWKLAIGRSCDVITSFEIATFVLYFALFQAAGFCHLAILVTF